MSHSGKHFMNQASTLVQDSIQGLAISNPDISVDIKYKVAYQRNPSKDSVAIICGGGSGHEPAHSGFVGEGMLNAAVCGNIFASPNPKQVMKALELVSNSQGTVIIVKNYTGDVLNFGLAKERFASIHPNQASKVRFVVVADDVAVGRTQGSIVGRRGLAGTVLVYKLAGALAKRGGNVDQVEELASYIASRVGTIGVGLGHCHVPGTESAAEAQLKPDEYEIGMGIHNEPGHKRGSPIPPLEKLVDEMVEMLTSTNDTERSFLDIGSNKSNQVVLLVNNLGGTSELEMGAVAAAATLEMRRRGYEIARILMGTFMTSLNMPGISLTVLLLPRAGDSCPFTSEEILDLLDDKPNVPAWKLATKMAVYTDGENQDNQLHTENSSLTDRQVRVPDSAAFLQLVKKACEALIKAEPEITKMDQIGGDGDCGLTLKKGAEGVLGMLSEHRITGSNLIADVQAISLAVEDHMDGTSGALYCIFFSALVQALYDQAPNGEVKWDQDIAARALSKALARLYNYTRARPPSRTLIDPLDAFISALKEGKGWQEAYLQAANAAEATKNLPAKAGRAAYVPQNSLLNNYDPGE
ncbi:putative glycerone kinase isoform [Serendipita vermifera]|nr:putative glycerone kinase isoform [Serendipita vermifera]